MNVLKQYCNMKKDLNGELYCVSSLKLNYTEGYIDISMLHYVHKQLAKYEHPPPKRRHNYPYASEPRKYGTLAPTVKPDSPALDATYIKYFQHIVRSCLLCTIDLTILHPLNSIVANSSKSTERTMERVRQLLEYMHSNPNVIICFDKQTWF